MTGLTTEKNSAGVTERARQEAEEYRGDNPRPLGGYLAVLVIYSTLVAATTLVAVLSDVAPATGKSTQVTAGFLLASQRAVDPQKSSYSPSGQLIRPWHPFTKASQQPVTPGDPNEYQIEIYPTSQVFKKGHQIRLTIGTADTPATSTPLPDLVNELGTITVLHGPAYPSNVLLPVIGSR